MFVIVIPQHIVVFRNYFSVKKTYRFRPPLLEEQLKQSLKFCVGFLLLG